MQLLCRMSPVTPEEPATLERPPARVPSQTARIGRWLQRRLSGRIAKRLAWIAGVLACVVIVIAVFAIRDYRKLAEVVDRQLERGQYARTVNFYASPETISIGDKGTAADLAATLQKTGYHDSRRDGEAWFENRGDSIKIHPRDSSQDPVSISFAGGAIGAITSAKSGAVLDAFTLQPALVSNVSNSGRERRVFVHFADLPPVLVQAITSAEDKHFFTHGGYDPLRIAKAMYVDTRDGRKEQGASTISMQLARNLYLNPEKRWQRKLTELLITIHLEHALSKQQIFEYYCNEVFLGGYGTFSINGFGEASHAYFNKDVSRLSVPEAALLAGLIQRPSYFNPIRFPDRARDRRNVVLRLMHANRYISDDQMANAISSPVQISPGKSEVSETQYSMDMANSEFQKVFEGQESAGVTNVYTTIDMRLQQAAERAVTAGMAQVDRLLAKHKGADGKPAKAQAAMIVLDPHTGEIKAMVGGRDYSVSQLDRILAERPPGSVFKPFVYAAALNTAINGSEHVFTPASMVNDVPTTFSFDGQTYRPSNFKNEYNGTVTFRRALAKSMNVAAVKVGEMVGFDAVVALAKQAGMNEDIRPTPAVALGSYQVTPLEIARAYTVFANGGMMVQPTSIHSIYDQSGTSLFLANSTVQRVLDPRVNFLMVDMMQDVLKYGTAASVRTRGFTLPAAGKTGTSHDGWFAGFTSQLLCVVWVGFDDYSELGLEGAHSALPIWTQFMMEASRYRPYRDAQVFPQPDGIVRVSIDPTTGLRSTPFCPKTDTDFFIDGTQPQQLCLVHQDDAVPTLPSQSTTSGLPLGELPALPPSPPETK